jgi:hypothetical protein
MDGLAPSAAPGPATPYPARPYGAPAGPSQYPGSGQGGGNLAANALFDAGALPTWLGGAGTNGQPARPGATPLGGDGLQMSTLVDERALPMWLRQEPEAPPAQTPQPGSVSRWLSAPVTEEPMPSFLNQVYDTAQVSRTATPPGPPSYWGAAAMPATPPMPGAVPSANLVDDSALPQWLRAQVDGQPSFQSPAAPAYQPPTYQAPGAFGAAFDDAPPSWGGPAPAADPAPANGPAGSFAASDLIEPGAVPAWVRQGAPPAQQEFSSTKGWTDHHPAQAPGNAAAGGQQGMGMNPGWDVSALRAPSASANLPSWLQAPSAPAEPAPAGGWSAPTGHHRARESRIPPAELPPWLQNGADPAAAAHHAPPEPASTDQQWDELQRGWDDDASGRFDDSGHYLDSFGVEEPGTGQPFGLEYDRQLRAAADAPADPGEQWRAGAAENTKGKRKRRGR